MKFNYDADSPFTGNKSVLIEPDEISGRTMAICMDTGYYTYNTWLDGSDDVSRFEETAPQLILDTRAVDGNNMVWFKTTAMSLNAILNPIIGNDSIDWAVSKLRDVLHGETPDSDLVLIVPIDADNAVTKIIDSDTTAVFKELQFRDAMDYFYQLSNLN